MNKTHKNIFIKYGFYCILKYKTKIVLIQRSKSPFKFYWDLPGGKNNFSETPIDALKREVFEETGLRIFNVKLFDIVDCVYSSMKIRYHHIGIIYLGRINNLNGLDFINTYDKSIEFNDSKQAEIFSFNKIKYLKLTPLTKKVLDLYFKNRTQTLSQ